MSDEDEPAGKDQVIPASLAPGQQDWDTQPEAAAAVQPRQASRQSVRPEGQEAF